MFGGRLNGSAGNFGTGLLGEVTQMGEEIESGWYASIVGLPDKVDRNFYRTFNLPLQLT